MSTSSTPGLSITSVSAGYGPATVIHDIDLTVRPGEIVALIGHNGAGKTTICSTIAGLVRCRSGRVVFNGEDLTAAGTDVRVRAGICLVPQTRNTFTDLSVTENLALAARAGGARRERRDPAWIFDIFPDLQTKSAARAGTLSGGQRQMLAVGIALVRDPQLLMLDEPSLGLSPLLVRRVFDTVKSINEEFGTAIIVVEQNVPEVSRIAERTYVINSGEVAAEGRSDEVEGRADIFELL